MTPNKSQMPATYHELDAYLGKQHARTIANNTTAERADDGPAIVVRLHGHEIARLWPRSVRVRDAGWQTPTTKDRLNRMLAPYGARIAQHEYQWYYESGRTRGPWYGEHVLETD